MPLSTLTAESVPTGWSNYQKSPLPPCSPVPGHMAWEAQTVGRILAFLCSLGVGHRLHKYTSSPGSKSCYHYLRNNSFSSVQFSPVAQSCPTLCDPMNCSTSGLPVHHQLPEFTQTHVHLVSDAIQPSHPLSSPSPPAPNPSQHQSLFQ